MRMGGVQTLLSSKPEWLYLICLKLDVEFPLHLKMVTPAYIAVVPNCDTMAVPQGSVVSYSYIFKEHLYSR